jgi:hypothetical protein
MEKRLDQDRQQTDGSKEETTKREGEQNGRYTILNERKRDRIEARKRERDFQSFAPIFHFQNREISQSN